MSPIRHVGLPVLGIVLCACGTDGDGSKASGGAAGSGSVSAGAGGGGASGSAGAGQGGAALINKGAISLELSETTCVSQTSWALPDPAAPVTATERGTLALDHGRNSDVSVGCLVEHMPDGSWDIAVSIALDRAETVLSLSAFVDPQVPSEGGFQLFGPPVREDISSNNAGPCLFTLIEVTDGKVWGKVDCATTHERDMTECGSAVIYYAFEDCYDDRAQFNAR